VALVPSTAGAFARAMDTVLEARITNMEADLAAALDPDTAPLALLPFLAWHKGLTHWSSAWPEHVQRRVLREARLIVRQRGTRAGIERALEAYGASLQIIEWWETSPQGTPGTWDVEVEPGADIEVDAAVQDDIAEHLRQTTALSRPWELTVGTTATVETLAIVHWRAASLVTVTGEMTV
jgi:phage tail P2-like protein